jgi:hypothetical protein
LTPPTSMTCFTMFLKLLLLKGILM